MKNSDVMRRLRGPKGSRVDVKVMRQNVPGLIDFSITRADIPIYSVDASYMADPQQDIYAYRALPNRPQGIFGSS